MNERAPNDLILYLILLLVIANLVLTAVLWTSQDTRPAEVQTTVTGLPASLDSAKLTELAERYKELYNADDIRALYADFDDLVKIQLTEKEVVDQFGELKGLVGKIQSFAFTHHDSSRYGNYPLYTLHYKVRLDGPLPAGNMQITVIDRGDAFGLFRFYVHGGTSQ